MNLKKNGKSKQFFKSYTNIIIVGAFVFLLIPINIYLYRSGSASIIIVNSVINPPLAIGVTIWAFLLMRGMARGTSSRALWMGLVIGWGCWALAEIWWVVALILNQEVPYPSWADFLWCLGYLPMYYAFALRLRSLPHKTAQKGKWILIPILVAILGFTGYGILLPIIRDFDPSIFLESFLNLFYPLADTIILIFVIRIFLAYQSGMYGRAWLWISVGFLFSSFSDLLFTYSSGMDLYYPDGVANFLSVFVVDIPYTCSYLLYLVGLTILQQMRTIASPFVESQKNAPVIEEPMVAVAARKIPSEKVQVEAAFQKTITDWVQDLEVRDQLGEGITAHIAEVTTRLAARMGVKDVTDLSNIRRGALLHDLGKLYLPSELLRKPGQLSEEEWQKMKQHPIIAYDLLNKIDYLKPALIIPYFHHERWDGSGYPQGLANEAIPLWARIFAVIDVATAMTSFRPYRKALPFQDTIQYIRSESGKLFDPQVVTVFFDLLASRNLVPAGV